MDDAETVFVSLGSAAENIEAAVDYLRRTRGASVGSIHVNVIRPFPEAAIVAALKGKKNVIILERTDEALAGDNPLGRDIRTAFSKAVAIVAKACPPSRWPKFPRSYGGSYGLGSRDFRPEHIIGAYEFATAGRARKDGKTRRRRRLLLRPRHRPSLRCPRRRDALATSRGRRRRSLPLHRRLGRHHHRQESRRHPRRPERPDLRARRPQGLARQPQGSHPRHGQPEIRLREEGRADFAILWSPPKTASASTAICAT